LWGKQTLNRAYVGAQDSPCKGRAKKEEAIKENQKILQQEVSEREKKGGGAQNHCWLPDFGASSLNTSETGD